MTEVFIVSEKEEIFVHFSRVLSHMPVHFSWVGNLDDAEKQFKNEKPDFIFFAVKKLTLLHNWLARYKSFKLNTPFICFISKIGWEKRELLWMTGAAQVIELPKLKKEFIQIVESVILPNEVSNLSNNELSGNLNVFDVIDLIKNFEEGRKNGIVEIKRKNKIGQLHFNKGQIVNAVYGSKDPLEAVLTMSEWKTGIFLAKPDNVRHSVHLHLDNKQIIKECQNHILQREKLLYSLPDKNIVFYPAPTLDFEEIPHAMRLNILYFKHGKSLGQFFEEEEDESTQLLTELSSWIKTKKLVQIAEYKDQLYLIKMKESKSAVRKMLDKILSKDTKPKFVKTQEKHKELQSSEDLINAQKKKEHLFSDYEYLQKFSEILEKSI